MNNIVLTDDDRQIPSNGESSSDDISSVATENLLPVYRSSIGNTHVCSVKVNNRSSLPNLKIKHPYRPDGNENDPFNDERKIITDKHVKVSRVKRSSLRSLNAEISLLRLDASSRRKSTGNVSVSRTNRRISQSVNQITSREKTVRVDRTSTAANKNQDLNRRQTASNPLVTRISFSNGLPFNLTQKELHASVKHLSVNQKKSS